MSDAMLHGVLNMPMPDVPAEIDLVTWLQFRGRARNASARIRELKAERDRLREVLQWKVDLIDKTVTPNGTDIARLQLEDGSWHTGPVVDWVHKTLKGWQSIARDALQTDTDTL